MSFGQYDGKTVQARPLHGPSKTKPPLIMITRPRWTKTALIFGGAAAWGALLVSCVMVNRTMLAPPQIAGAEFVGNKECAQCHEEQTAKFATASHAKLAFADSKVGATGCEACHGAGSLHVKAGGGKGTIINPKKSADSCFQCHTDKRGEFSLANAHGVMSGKMSCGDCHDPHEGNAVKGTAAARESEIETCTKCHSSQKGPFIFPHYAMKEGCTACHSPHGSVNAKMLVARDGNLCQRCHLNPSTTAGTLMVGGEDHRTRMNTTTCWGAGCHEAVHGSNVNKPLRF
jgi:predicted CXXCH cytochrome family protein